MHRSRIALSIAAVLAGPALARAETVEEKPVTTPAGREIRLGAYAAFKADCSGSAATLKPSGDQRGGIIVVTQGTLTTTHVPGCSSATAPAQILFYRPNPGFTGADRVTFGVVNPATGETVAEYSGAGGRAFHHKDLI